jgi:hypothetical protein
LNSITLGNNLQVIDWDAFFGCSELTYLELPATVTTIGFGALSGMTALTDVYYAGSEEQWNAIDINEYNDGLEHATIHYNSVRE